jgi:hypothetical protein
MENESQRFIRLVVRISGLLLILLVFVSPGFSQVRGEYSPGPILIEGGTIPDPGFSFSNQLWTNSSSRLMGPRGNPLAIRGSVSVWIDNNSVVYVPTFKLLGAQLEFVVDISVANGRFAARDSLNIGPGISGSGAGLTNTTLVPFDLGWHLKWVDIQTGYSIYAPTGRFVAGSSNNVSSGFWTNGWQTGATIYLTGSKSVQLSVFNYYAWNSVQQGTGVHPGQNDSIDYSLSRTFSISKGGKWTLLIGPAGYGQWQTNNNGGQNPIRAALKYGVDAVGVTLNISSPFKRLSIGSSTLWEYGARNTYEGQTMTITAGFNF